MKNMKFLGITLSRDTQPIGWIKQNIAERYLKRPK